MKLRKPEKILLGVVIVALVFVIWLYLRPPRVYTPPGENNKMIEVTTTSILPVFELTLFEKVANEPVFNKEGFISAFTQTCPRVSDCSIDLIFLYLDKMIQNGSDISHIPRISQIKETVASKLVEQEQGFQSPKLFWENHGTLKSATMVGILSKEQLDSWIIRLAETDPAELCPRLYSQETEPRGEFNKFIPIGIHVEDYTGYCHLRLYSTLMQMMYARFNASPRFSMLEEYALDSENVKMHFCRDVSQVGEKPHFNFLSPFGVLLLNQHWRCGIPLKTSLLEKVNHQLSIGNSSPYAEGLKVGLERLGLYQNI